MSVFLPVPFIESQRGDNNMSNVSQLPSFPNTILNLDDKPNLSAQNMKEALQRDTAALWQKCIEVIASLNSKTDESEKASVVNASSTNDTYPSSLAVYNAINTLIAAQHPLPVAKGGTGGTTKPAARNGIGIYVGNTVPSEMVSTLDVGDIYLYVPDLP